MEGHFLFCFLFLPANDETKENSAQLRTALSLKAVRPWLLHIQTDPQGKYFFGRRARIRTLHFESVYLNSTCYDSNKTGLWYAGIERSLSVDQLSKFFQLVHLSQLFQPVRFNRGNQVISGPRNPPKLCRPRFLACLNTKNSFEILKFITGRPKTIIDINVLSSSGREATAYLAFRQTLTDNQLE